MGRVSLLPQTAGSPFASPTRGRLEKDNHEDVDEDTDPGRKPEPPGHDRGGHDPARGDPSRTALGGLLLPQDRAARPRRGASSSSSSRIACATLQRALPRLGLERAAAETRARRPRADPAVPHARRATCRRRTASPCSPAAASKLFEAVALPFVHRSRLAVDRSPLVRELVAAQEEFGRLYAVVTDRSSGAHLRGDGRRGEGSGGAHRVGAPVAAATAATRTRRAGASTTTTTASARRSSVTTTRWRGRSSRSTARHPAHGILRGRAPAPTRRRSRRSCTSRCRSGWWPRSS